MRLRGGSRTVGFFIAFLAALPAMSHPLGSFSIDHYSRLHVTSRDVRLRYVIDMAEIPTFQELLEADIDRDRQVSEKERQAFVERTVKSLTSRLTCTLNGTSFVWRIEQSHLTAPSSVVPLRAGSGSVTLRILVDLRAEFPTPLSSENIVRYADGNYPGRTGWKEIIVDGGEEIRLLRSSAQRKDLSNELTQYPQDVWVPPQDVTTEFAFTTSAESGWVRAARAVSGEEHYPWFLVAIAALALFLRWRAGRKTAALARPTRDWRAAVLKASSVSSSIPADTPAEDQTLPS